MKRSYLLSLSGGLLAAVTFFLYIRGYVLFALAPPILLIAGGLLALKKRRAAPVLSLGGAVLGLTPLLWSVSYGYAVYLAFEPGGGLGGFALLFVSGAWLSTIGIIGCLLGLVGALLEARKQRGAAGGQALNLRPEMLLVLCGGVIAVVALFVSPFVYGSIASLFDVIIQPDGYLIVWPGPLAALLVLAGGLLALSGRKAAYLLGLSGALIGLAFLLLFLSPPFVALAGSFYKQHVGIAYWLTGLGYALGLVGAVLGWWERSRVPAANAWASAVSAPAGGPAGQADVTIERIAPQAQGGLKRPWKLALAALLIVVVIVAAGGVYALTQQHAAGAITEFSLPSNGHPRQITTGPDGALWFTDAGNNAIGRITTSGTITEFPVPTSNSLLEGITTGPDGNLWFTEGNGNQIGRITPAGQVTEFPLPNPNSEPEAITTGPDGNLWFTDNYGIGQITPDGAITEFRLSAGPGLGGMPFGIAAGRDGALWFSDLENRKIGRMALDGTATEFPLNPNSNPRGIAAGPDGNIWFTDGEDNQIGRLTPAGVVTTFPLPTARSDPYWMTAGPDGNLWFTEGNGQIGRITPAGKVAEFPLPSSASNPGGIAAGPDGNLWFTENVSPSISQSTGKIGRLISGAAPARLAPTATRLPTPTATSTPAATSNPFSGTLAFSDPLQDNRNGWCQGFDSAEVNFTNGVFHLNNAGAFGPSYIPCVARSTNFSNFAYQVEMTMIKGGDVAGDGGGILFRVMNTFVAGYADYYRFRIGPDGSYDLNIKPYSGSERPLKSGFSSAIKTGLNQMNLIGVVARGSTLDFYINGQFVVSVEDSTYTHGAIGLFTFDGGHPRNAADPPVQVEFRNIQVWVA